MIELNFIPPLLVLMVAIQVAQIATMFHLENRREKFAADLDQIAGAIAARLIESYEGELEQLSENGVKTFARERYVTLTAASGLPISFTDIVTQKVWNHIEAAKNESN